MSGLPEGSESTTVVTSADALPTSNTEEKVRPLSLASVQPSSTKTSNDPQDVPAEFLPPLSSISKTSSLSSDQVRELARRSLANARDPPAPPGEQAGNRTSARVSTRKSVRTPFDDVAATAVAVPDDPDAEADAAAEVYYVDTETGKALVTKSTVHKGRPASVVVEVGPEGQVIGVVGGTARLPGESERQYLRKMSSFAGWQLHESSSSTYIRWQGDQKYAFFCYLVIFVTFIMLIVEIGINGGIEPFGANPTFGPARDVLLRLGAKRTDLIVNGDFHRLIAPWWLHGGILHWVVNMLALGNLGISLEKEFGTPKIAIIFCSCGFMGVLCSAVFLPNVVGVGASGAIFGLFGSCFSDLIQNWGLYKSRGNAKSVLCQLVFGAIINFLLGFLPMLDQFAHMAGFATGVCLGFVFLVQKRFTRFGEEKNVKFKQRALQIIGAVTVVFGMIILLVTLYQGVDPDGWCSWCSYINCIPISGLWNCDDSGCSDDRNVRGIPFPNSTMEVHCPTNTNGRVVYTTIQRSPTPEDVAEFCRQLCFD